MASIKRYTKYFNSKAKRTVKSKKARKELYELEQEEEQEEGWFDFLFTFDFWIKVISTVLATLIVDHFWPHKGW